MNEFISRSNIYFMYNRNNIDSIKLLLLDHTNVILFPANEIMGQLDDFVDNPDIVFAPIDILLYHLKELEYLHNSENENLKDSYETRIEDYKEKIQNYKDSLSELE